VDEKLSRVTYGSEVGLRVYLDSCALNRLTDPKGQPRIDKESGAVELIFRYIEDGRLSWLASSILEIELSKMPDAQRRADSLGLLRYAAEVRQPTPNTAPRADVLTGLGYAPFDALHLAMAEEGDVELFLTTDDRFLRKMQRGLGNPTVQAANPVDWLREKVP
jgi:hypothetical protein